MFRVLLFLKMTQLIRERDRIGSWVFMTLLESETKYSIYIRNGHTWVRVRVFMTFLESETKYSIYTRKGHTWG